MKTAPTLLENKMQDTSTAQEEFQNLRFGMFIHFGIYSLGEEHEWHMFKHRMKHDDYKRKFMGRFDPDPKGIEQWVITAKAMGAKYMVVTSKHHDGFCLWDTKINHGVDSEFHIRDTPFWEHHQKSILDYLFEAGRKHGIRIGLYYSTIDWSWTGIEKRAFRPQFHVLLKKKHQDIHNRYVEYYKDQVLELAQLYPDVLCFWFDGYQFRHPLHPHGFLDYLDYPALYKEIKNINPAILVGNNTGTTKSAKKMGDNDLLLLENMSGLGQSNAAPWPRKSVLPGEVCLTINRAWGYAKKDKHYKTAESMQRLVIDNALRNANTLLNFGPQPDGYIAQDQVAIAVKIGELLKPYAPLIYNTRSVAVEKWGGIAKNREDGSKYAYISKGNQTITLSDHGNLILESKEGQSLIKL